MTEKEIKSSPSKRITERERLNFIGFDVFPGDAKELFKSDAEKEKYLASVKSRHEQHDHLRESCTLLEERVPAADRMVLAIASVVILLALLLPWYGAYMEIVEEAAPLEMKEEVAAPVEGVDASLTSPTDPNATPAQVAQPTTPTTPANVPAETVANPVPAETPAEGTPPPTSLVTMTDAGEELITAFTAKKKIHKEYSRASGIGSFFLLGSAGSELFSSGIALMLTVVLLLVLTLMCLGIPIYNLYGLFGLKGEADAKALKLKKMLRMNWIPLIIFSACLMLSFFGGEYSFNAAEVFTSIGDSYSPMAFLGTLSWGIFISLACFVLCAVKGAEI